MALIKKIINKKFEYELDIDGTIITASEIKCMNREQLHTLCGFLESGPEIKFVKDNCEDELVEVYIQNLSYKI